MRERPSEHIDAHLHLFDLKLRDVLKYRDLLFMLVRRDFVTFYKQTILGPLWFFIQPIFTTIIYVVIFGKVAGLSTDGMPMSLFYLSGIVVWNFFAENVTRNATIFVDNRPLFSKVYFPRVVTPLAITLSGFMKLTIQLLLFLGFWCYEFYNNPDLIRPNAWLLMTPVICIMTAMLSMGIGMIVSGLTAKYRDLKFLMTFGVQLLLYLTPVIYPVSILSGNFKKIIHLNPLSSIIEVFRFGFLGSGEISLPWLGYSAGVCILFFMLGLVIFNRTEKNVMDTV